MYKHKWSLITMFRCDEQASPIFEGVAEIWINSQPCKGMNLTTWHMWARRAPRVAIAHDMIKESGWVLPHFSVIFHAYASMDTSWVAWTLSHCTPTKRGKVSSNSATHEATKFVGPQKISYVPVHNQSLFIPTQPTRALIDTSGTTTVEL
jgi:hypothetical protein